MRRLSPSLSPDGSSPSPSPSPQGSSPSPSPYKRTRVRLEYTVGLESYITGYSPSDMRKQVFCGYSVHLFAVGMLTVESQRQFRERSS